MCFNQTEGRMETLLMPLWWTLTQHKTQEPPYPCSVGFNHPLIWVRVVSTAAKLTVSARKQSRAQTLYSQFLRLIPTIWPSKGIRIEVTCFYKSNSSWTTSINRDWRRRRCKLSVNPAWSILWFPPHSLQIPNFFSSSRALLSTNSKREWTNARWVRTLLAFSPTYWVRFIPAVRRKSLIIFQVLHLSLTRAQMSPEMKKTHRVENLKKSVKI